MGLIRLTNERQSAIIIAMTRDNKIYERWCYMKPTIRGLAKILKVDESTLYRWRKDDPALWKYLWLGYQVDLVYQANKQEGS